MRNSKGVGYATRLPAANVYTVPCPLLRALAVIGGKWKLPILWHLSGGAARYGELKRGVAGVTHMMLAQCLRELEADGLVSRRDYGERPPRVEYALTEKGNALLPALRELYAWGEGLLEGSPASSAAFPGASPAASPDLSSDTSPGASPAASSATSPGASPEAFPEAAASKPE